MVPQNDDKGAIDWEREMAAAIKADLASNVDLSFVEENFRLTLDAFYPELWMSWRIGHLRHPESKGIVFVRGDGGEYVPQPRASDMLMKVTDRAVREFAFDCLSEVDPAKELTALFIEPEGERVYRLPYVRSSVDISETPS